MQAPIRRVVTALAVVVPAVLLLGGPAGAAAAPAAGDHDLVTFGIAPAGADRPDDRPFLAIQAAPGSVVHDHIALLNQDSRPIALQTYAADVVQTRSGGLSADAAGAKGGKESAWVKVEAPKTVAVPPQTKAHGIGFTIVPITLTIPKTAEPGDHVVGLVAALRAVGTPGKGTPAITLDQRVAARVYVRVSGDLTPDVEVDKIDSSFHGNGAGHGTATVTYRVRNTGNVRVGVVPSVTVSGPFGAADRTAQGATITDLLPGGTGTATVTIKGVWVMGVNPVDVKATVVAAPAGQDPGLGTVHGSSVLWATSWGQAVALVAVAGLVVWLVLRARRVRAWNRYWLAQQAAAAEAVPGEGAEKEAVR